MNTLTKFAAAVGPMFGLAATPADAALFFDLVAEYGTDNTKIVIAD